MGLNHHQKCISFGFDHTNNSLTCFVPCYNYSNVLLSDYFRSSKTYFGNLMVVYTGCSTVLICIPLSNAIISNPLSACNGWAEKITVREK